MTRLSIHAIVHASAHLRICLLTYTGCIEKSLWDRHSICGPKETQSILRVSSDDQLTCQGTAHSGDDTVISSLAFWHFDVLIQ